MKRRDLIIGGASAWALGCPVGARRHDPPAAAIEAVEVDCAAVEGAFDRLSGVQGSPAPLVAGDVDRVALFREHGVERARIDQDCAPNTLTLGGVFPDEAADPDRPESYRFAAIDAHVAAARAAGAGVLWQAGYDVGQSDRWVGPNLGGRAPRDLDRWARVVVRCLEHFNHGWAGGLDRAVEAVEFPNEPDGLGGFVGDDAPRLLPAFVGFLAAVRAHNQAHPDAPVVAVGPGLPFSLAEWPDRRDRLASALARLHADGIALPAFSFHTYGDDVAPAANAALARAVRALLDAHGMRDTELWNTEWLAGDFLRRHLDLDERRAAASTLDERRRYAAGMAAYALACKVRWQGVVQRSYYYRINHRVHPPGRADPFAGEGSFLSSAARPGALALHESLTRRAALAAPLRCRTAHDDDGLVTVQGLCAGDRRVCGLLVSNLRAAPLRLRVAFAGAAASPTGSALTLDEGSALAVRRVSGRRDGDRIVVESTLRALTSEWIALDPG